MPASNLANNLVLNSWKEIASHVGRGVRTVQRWERDLGMPVRRPRAKSRSAVVAMADEIDAWLRSAPTGELPTNHAPKASETSQMLDRLRQSVEQHVDLRDQCNRLRSANHQALMALISNLQMMTQSARNSRIPTMSESNQPAA